MKPEIEMRSRKLIGGAVVCGGLMLAAVGLGPGVANAAPAPAQISEAQLAAFQAPVPLYGPGFIGPRPHFGGGRGFRGGYGHGFGRGHFDRGHFGRGFGRGHYGRGFGRGFGGHGRFY
jgi:hypothetical protein